MYPSTILILAPIFSYPLVIAHVPSHILLRVVRDRLCFEGEADGVDGAD